MRGILYSFLAGMFTDALTPDTEEKKKKSYFHFKGKPQVFLKQEEQVASPGHLWYLHFFFLANLHVMNSCSQRLICNMLAFKSRRLRQIKPL